MALRSKSNKVSLSIFGVDPLVADIDPKWKPFPELLEGAGISLLAQSDVTSDTTFVAVEHRHKSLSSVERILPRANRILVCVEPNVVNPAQFTQKVQSRYGHVISIALELGPGRVDRLWDGGHLPDKNTIMQRLRSNEHSVREPSSVGMLNANKFSVVRGSLYKTRFDTLRTLSRHGVPTYLGGHNWGDPYRLQVKQVIYSAFQAIGSAQIPDVFELEPRNARLLAPIEFMGAATSPQEFFSRFEYGIAIENQLGYFTEKALNVMLAGAIPLYMGGKPKDFGVPQEAVLDVHQEFGGDFHEAYRSLQGNPRRKSTILTTARDWLLSGAASERWGIEEGQHKLAKLIRELQGGAGK